MCFDWFGCVGQSLGTAGSLTGLEDLEGWAGVGEDACFWTARESQFSACTEHQADPCCPALERQVETQLPLRNRDSRTSNENIQIFDISFHHFIYLFAWL